MRIDGDRETEQQADDGDAHRSRSCKEESHAGIPLRALRAFLRLLFGVFAGRRRAACTYDEPTSQAATTSDANCHFSYGYDGLSNRVSTTREGGTAEIYGYDSSMRLTRVDYGASKTVRPCLGSPAVTNFSGSFNAFNQQLTRSRTGGGLPVLNSTFAYDDIGNTLSETAGTAVTSYTWDRDNRLRTVTPPAPTVPTAYSYDANGLRVQRVDITGTTRYVLDRHNVLAELDGASATSTRYLNNPQLMDDIISFERGGSSYYPLTDALGSVYAVTDASGAVVHRFDFDVYGARADLGGAGLTLDVGFTGRWHDSNNLIDYRERLRLPVFGVFLRPDRLGLQDGPNAYLYAGANPVLFVDPLGRSYIQRLIAEYAASETLTSAMLFFEGAMLAEEPEVAAAMVLYANWLITLHLVASHVAQDPGLCQEAERIAALEARATKLGLKINSKTTGQLIEYWNRPVSEFISKFRLGSIRREFPTNFLNKTVGEALENGGNTVRKLLTDGRFLR